MKKVYWYLLLLGFWCAASGVWYLTVMKGVRSDPRFFDPHISATAIAEILVMLLGACLIGYGIGWSVREGPMGSLREDVTQLESDKTAMLVARQSAEELLRQTQQQSVQTQQSLASKLNKAKQETETLTGELLSLNTELGQLRLKIAENEQQQIQENTLRYRIKQLEFQNLELTESRNKIQQELDEAIARQTRKTAEPAHPFVRPSEISERDDLTVIKGIGPFIEKRLNMVGIFTLRQISEFTPEVIEHVARAIEFFPNRITKDDWAGQASRLL